MAPPGRTGIPPRPVTPLGTISQGDLTVFVTHPIAASLLALAAIALAAPFVMRMWRRGR